MEDTIGNLKSIDDRPQPIWRIEIPEVNEDHLDVLYTGFFCRMRSIIDPNYLCINNLSVKCHGCIHNGAETKILISSITGNRSNWIQKVKLLLKYYRCG